MQSLVNQAATVVMMALRGEDTEPRLAANTVSPRET